MGIPLTHTATFSESQQILFIKLQLGVGKGNSMSLKVSCTSSALPKPQLQGDKRGTEKQKEATPWPEAATLIPRLAGKLP